MTERPILFSAPMVRAILEGRKTQTRRIVKPQPERDLNTFGWKWWHKSLNAGHLHTTANAMVRLMAPLCPYGQPGDRLWVREAFAGSIAYERHGYPLKEWGNKLWYLADGEPRSGQWTRPRASIHMPRCLSRITLEITEVRVERLNAMTGMDAKREGVDVPPWIPEDGADLDWAKRTFAGVWESIHGPDSWAANPWVWVVGFRRVTP